MIHYNLGDKDVGLNKYCRNSLTKYWALSILDGACGEGFFQDWMSAECLKKGVVDGKKLMTCTHARVEWEVG